MFHLPVSSKRLYLINHLTISNAHTRLVNLILNRAGMNYSLVAQSKYLMVPKLLIFPGHRIPIPLAWHLNILLRHS